MATAIARGREQLGRVFELFARVDVSLERSRGGLGIGMPGLNGFELAWRVRCFDEHVVKPIDISGIEAVCRRALERRRGADARKGSPVVAD